MRAKTIARTMSTSWPPKRDQSIPASPGRFPGAARKAASSAKGNAKTLWAILMSAAMRRKELNGEVTVAFMSVQCRKSRPDVHFPGASRFSSSKKFSVTLISVRSFAAFCPLTIIRNCSPSGNRLKKSFAAS